MNSPQALCLHQSCLYKVEAAEEDAHTRGMTSSSPGTSQGTSDIPDGQNTHHHFSVDQIVM